jgi:hypothetical protein
VPFDPANAPSRQRTLLNEADTYVPHPRANRWITSPRRGALVAGSPSDTAGRHHRAAGNNLTIPR